MPLNTHRIIQMHLGSLGCLPKLRACESRFCAASLDAPKCKCALVKVFVGVRVLQYNVRRLRGKARAAFCGGDEQRRGRQPSA
jgi:hypothetical protein